MKAFQIKTKGEVDIVASESLLKAIVFYTAVNGLSEEDFDDDDEIIEIPKEQWATFVIKNTDYDPEDPEDKEEFILEEYMKEIDSPEIIGSTAYLN